MTDTDKRTDVLLVLLSWMEDPDDTPDLFIIHVSKYVIYVHSRYLVVRDKITK